MEPISSSGPSTPSQSPTRSKGSKVGKVLQKVADKVSGLVSSNRLKVGEFVAEKEVKASPLNYEDMKIGGLYVLKYPPNSLHEGLYQVVKIIEKPAPLMSDRSVDLVMISDDKNEPQYVFASWLRKLNDN
ncbi:MAG: hypothetical protein ACK4HV_02220 [Parachlamydiaceae bacterium]